MKYLLFISSTSLISEQWPEWVEGVLQITSCWQKEQWKECEKTQTKVFCIGTSCRGSAVLKTRSLSSTVYSEYVIQRFVEWNMVNGNIITVCITLSLFCTDCSYLSWNSLHYKIKQNYKNITWFQKYMTQSNWCFHWDWPAFVTLRSQLFASEILNLHWTLTQTSYRYIIKFTA